MEEVESHVRLSKMAYSGENLRWGWIIRLLLSTGKKRAPRHVREMELFRVADFEVMTDRWCFGIISENN